MEYIKPYAKFWVAFVTFVLITTLVAVKDVLGDGVIDTEDILTVLIALLGAVSVYLVPNQQLGA